MIATDFHFESQIGQNGVSYDDDSDALRFEKALDRQGLNFGGAGALGMAELRPTKLWK